MTALEKIKDFICGYPNANILKRFNVDYTDQIPVNNGGIFPSGLVEMSRERDVTGKTVVTNQYNFGLYYVLEKAPKDNEGATINAEWIMDFQEWVQEQSITGNAPVFGDIPSEEKITAQNGALYDANDEGLGTYMVQITATFKKIFTSENLWTKKITR